MSTQAGRRTGIGRRAGALIAAAAAVGAVTALPAQAAPTARAVGGAGAVRGGGEAGAAGGPSVPPYAFDGSAQRIQGAASSLDAKTLQAGRTYRDTLKKDGKAYYRVDLDTKRNTYVSVVAVPGPGGKVEYGDGFKVGIQDNTGADCGHQQVDFGSGQYARPLAAYARRTVDPGSSSCQEQGAHYVLVERESAATSTPDDWELELRYVTEPLLERPGPTALPEAWPSGTPAPPAGGQQKRQGGAGFHEAVALREGEWRADIRPGQTLFYRVPVDWGQQLFAGAELGSGTEGDSVSDALTLTLDNPALGFVDTATVRYDGKPATLALDPLRPVAHENRTSYQEATSGMRFAGWYYLTATLSPEVAAEYGDGPVPLTLRVNVEGSPKQAPPYDADPGIFSVMADDREAAANGATGAPATTNGTMAIVATAGIGTGTVLLLGLGAWTLLARRRA
ncbi:hypothetical protein GCM10010275_09200 [Streptomyces litmocidini]|uniref:hypothetical protein n=1 Tax=Streptomyces litmocidini TaxID=67318 RepID=UPI00167CF204|nr:hypothetical protein [Streptomyces litmocidini]GGU76826.1 hypothetical protein GCM10010275_09200 [Streptomyces litmocidini]